MTTAEKEEIIRLSEALLDRRIKRVELARLEELLDGSDEAIDLYLEIVHDEATLKDLLVHGKDVILANSESTKSYLPHLLAAAAALTFLALASWWMIGGQPGKDPYPNLVDENVAPAGILTGGLGVSWADGVGPFSISDPIAGQRIIIERGALEVTCSNGIVLLVEGPASFLLKDEMNLELSYGSIVGDVPPAGHGFSVKTGRHELIDHGTRFGMKVSRNEAVIPTEVAVFQGEVEVIPGNAEDSVMLYRHDSVALTDQSVTGVLNIPLDQSRFLKELPLGELPWEMPTVPQEKHEILTFDVTELVRGPGQYFAVFKWMFGKNALTTKDVTLLLNGKPVWMDDHVARIGTLDKTNKNIYWLRIPEESYQPGRWTLQVDAVCQASTLFRQSEEYRRGVRHPSDSSGVLYFDDSGFLSNKAEEFVGRWRYMYNGAEHERRLFPDGTAHLQGPDGRIQDDAVWWMEGDVMFMHFPENNGTERHLLRGGTLLFIDRPYRDALRYKE